MKSSSGIRIKSKSWKFCEDSWYFRSAMPSVTLENREIKPSYEVKSGENQSTAKSSFKNIDVELSFPTYKGCFSSMTIDITNKSRSPVWIEKIKFLDINTASSPAKISGKGQKRDGLRMLIYNDSARARNSEEMLSNGSSPFLKNACLNSDVNHNTSRLFTCIYDPALQQGVFFGMLSDKGRIFNSCFTKTGNSFEGISEVKISIKPKTKVRIGRLIVSGGRDIRKSLFKFASLFGRPRPVPNLAKNAGWNSWDYYLWQVTANDIIENVDFIKRTPWLKKCVKYIIIDDGWSHRYGEWEPNYKFPGGMKALANKIKKAGFIPGIWIGPFMMDKRGALEASHPEFEIKSKDRGKRLLVGAGQTKLPYLDPTHPGTLKFLHETFSKLRNDGYRYFKIDFLSNVINAGRNGQFYNPNVTPIEALKGGISTIREAIGEDSILVGCGGFVPEIGTGIYDSCRASIDISSYWSNILVVARDMAIKSIFNGRTWENDYDFLIVRSRQTSKEKRLNVYKDLRLFIPERPYEPFSIRKGDVIRTEHEVRVWASLILVSGSSIVLSDRLSMLNKKGLEMIKTVLENASGAAWYPLDLLSSGIPRIWLSKDKSTCLIGVFNWSDRKAVINTSKFLKREGFNIKKVYEIWKRKILPLDYVELGPRDCRVFRIEKQAIK
ncbi:MAG: alpha-galactosidase [bacterium]|nr:alpha-galactosidase [bacterium]